MLKFKELKKNSKNSLKKNYVITILVSIIGLIFLSLYGTTNSALIDGFECVQNYYDNGHFDTNRGIDYIESGLYKKTVNYNELYNLTDEELAEKGFNEAAIRYIHSLNPNVEDKQTLSERLKVRDGFIKPILNFASSDIKVLFKNIENMSLDLVLNGSIGSLSYTAIMSFILMILFRFLFLNVLSVGYSRFFLENSKYHSTRLGRCFLFFRKDYFKVARVMARKSIYQTLWNLTIVGGIIKLYSYKLVPYIIAEDSNISSKQAIYLSRKLMKGYKFKAFLLHFSFLGWNLLNGFTFGLSGLLFTNPYYEGANAEFYKAIIKEKKKEKFYAEYLEGRPYADKDLYIDDEKDFYPGAKPADNNLAFQNYKPLTLFLLFFVFAFVGWCMEVSLFLLKTHTFVNRGTLIGPWLPIYGFGCVLILIMFTKTRLRKYLNNPLILFLNIMILCGILEYFSSWMLETTTGLKYWDYTGHFLSINGRICFENLCEFGAGGLLCIYLFGPNLNLIIENVSKKKLIITIIVLFVLFITDNIYVRFHPRTGYGITDSIIDENGNIIGKDGEKIS